MSLSSGSPGRILFLIPSSMAISIPANVRYGLQAASGSRYSRRLAVGFGRVTGVRPGAREGDGRRPVPLAVRQVDRGVEPRHLPLVTVGRRVGERAQSRGVL